MYIHIQIYSYVYTYQNKYIHTCMHIYIYENTYFFSNLMSDCRHEDTATHCNTLQHTATHAYHL